jgi:hypothetical protein
MNRPAPAFRRYHRWMGPIARIPNDDRCREHRAGVIDRGVDRDGGSTRNLIDVPARTVTEHQ